MENVASGRLRRLANMVIALESRPPDRKIPIGTSAIRWRATAWSRHSRSVPASCSSELLSMLGGAQLVVLGLGLPTGAEVDLHHRRRAQLDDVAEGGPGRGDVAQRQERRYERRVDPGAAEAVVRERADLRRERQLPRAAAQVERLDAERAAHQRQLVRAPIQHDEGKHAFESLGELDRAEVLVAVHQDLGVGRAAERVPLLDEPLSQLEEVVDLAVVDDLDLTVFVGHRLVAERAEVDDRQAAHTHADAVLDERAAGVGAAMAHARRHRLDFFSLD